MAVDEMINCHLIIVSTIMTNENQNLNTPIAVGKTAEIYSWENDQILKLFIDGMPIEYAQHEASMTQAIFEAGLPIPEVGDVIEVNGRFGLLQQHIQGPTLLEAWLQNPAEPEPIAEALATLHWQMHAVKAPAVEAMPAQREWLHNSIAESERLTPSQKQDGLQSLKALADGEIVCHGDFHPGNIVCSKSGKLVIIDWFSAVSGHPLGDVAQSCFLLTQSSLPAILEPILAPAYRQRLQDRYLSHYFQAERLPDHFASWQEVVALADPG